MFGESRALLPDNNTPVTDRILERAVYAKAVVKEMFRMNPISVGVGRILPEECVFSGYRVPAGVNETYNIINYNIIILDVTIYYYMTSIEKFLQKTWATSVHSIDIRVLDHRSYLSGFQQTYS